MGHFSYLELPVLSNQKKLVMKDILEPVFSEESVSILEGSGCSCHSSLKHFADNNLI